MLSSLAVETDHVFVPAMSPVARSSKLTARIVDAAAWHEAIADFDEVAQEQLHAFAAARGTFVAVEPMLFLRDDEPVGGALIGIRRLPLGLASIAVIKWGPMLRHEDAADAPAIYAEMIDRIASEYGDRRHMAISILSRPALAEPNMRTAILRDRGFRDGTVWEYPHLHVLALRQSDETMRRTLAKKWRGHLNKAERSGLVFEVGGPERLAEMQQLYREMIERKKFDDLTPYHTLSALMELEDERLRPALFFVRREGSVVAGAVVFHAGERASYLYGATSAAALKSNAGHYLQWNIARWLRDNTRARYYSLGGTDGIKGLREFKTGLAGRNGITALVPPTAIYASTVRARVLGTLAFGARDVLALARRRFAGFKQ